jgi:hypothetical protein
VLSSPCGSGSGGSGGYPADHFEASAVGLQDEDFALLRDLAGERGDVDLMRHQGEHAGAAPGGDGRCGLARLLGFLRALPEEGVERCERLGSPEGELRRLERSAPGARQHALDAHAVRAEGLADAARLRAAGLGQVALRRAILEPEVRRIARARRPRVADERDRAARPQRAPRRLARGGSARRERADDRQRDDPSCRPPHHGCPPPMPDAAGRTL